MSYENPGLEEEIAIRKSVVYSLVPYEITEE
jgi:hypothetical protein